jgi:hypothetical protein
MGWVEVKAFAEEIASKAGRRNFMMDYSVFAKLEKDRMLFYGEIFRLTCFSMQ